MSRTSNVANSMAELRLLDSDRMVKLVASNNEAVTVSMRDLRKCCTLFETLFDEQPDLTEYHTDVSEGTLLFAKAVFEDGHHPELPNPFEAIVLGCKLGSARLAFNLEYFSEEIRSPPDAKVADIDLVVQTFVNYLALRTANLYEPLVDALTSHLTKQDKGVFIGRMNQAIKQRAHIIEPLPIPLSNAVVTVALMRDVLNKPMVAILHENNWLPFNIFGPKFCPFAEEVKNFHLMLDWYVVYEKSNGQVLMKDLTSDEPPQVLLANCKFFRSLDGQLHIICESDDDREGDCLYEWDDTERTTRKKFSAPSLRLRTAHNNDDNELIVVLEDGRTLNVSDEDEADHLAYEGELVSDRVSDCYRRLGDPCYSHRGLGDDQKPCVVALDQPVHVGFTRLNVTSCGDGTHRTVIWDKVDDCWQVIGNSQAHGPVTAFSDVFLLSPKPLI